MRDRSKDIIEFFLEIEPQAQERIRFKFRGYGKRRTITAYTPEATKEFQDSVREMVRGFMLENDIPEFSKGTPLALTAVFYLARPVSAKRRLAPVVRPDLSNYLKALEDGMQREVNGLEPALLADDSSICSIVCSKRYVDTEYPQEGILVSLREWSPDE